MIYDAIREWWKLALAGVLFVGGMGGIVYGCQIDSSKDAEMRTIPYEMTPHSIVRCYNKFGTLIYENKIVELGVEHVLTRVPCTVYYGGGCCISDPPTKDGEDSRKWGVGRTDGDKMTTIDGREVECVTIKMD
jgi:hypothetical protein